MLRRLTVLSLLLCAGLSGCSMLGFGGPSETRLILTVDSVNELNPDREGEARSLYVNMFVLKSAKAFTAATFSKLYDQPEATIGGDLMVKREYTFQPGEKREIDLTLEPEAQAIGIVAAYRAIDEADWRAVKDLRPGDKNRLRLVLGTTSISLEDNQ